MEFLGLHNALVLATREADRKWPNQNISNTNHRHQGLQLPIILAAIILVIGMGLIGNNIQRSIDNVNTSVLEAKKDFDQMAGAAIAVEIRRVFGSN